MQIVFQVARGYPGGSLGATITKEVQKKRKGRERKEKRGKESGKKKGKKPWGQKEKKDTLPCGFTRGNIVQCNKWNSNDRYTQLEFHWEQSNLDQVLWFAIQLYKFSPVIARPD